ncbi:MAG TPA: L-lactate dehydrogenase [Stellaceae bacterium]|nr:L-lactate dehydrogenase [Stellaceae bacterium]
MKLGIVGLGAVGSACAMAAVLRGSAREIVLVDRTRSRAKGVATDMRYGTPLSPPVAIADGDYEGLAGAGLVMITAGVNEKGGGATDRNDPAGRLRLLETNARIYEEIVPRVAASAPEAVILVVTDPPDPLADVARRAAGHDRVLSTGTFLDSLRFRVHLARKLGVAAGAVEAQVLGEHGTSSVFLWSTARVAGIPVLEEIRRRGGSAEGFREEIEREVRYANITIIEGIGASQYGIGMVCARIAEMVLRDEQAVIPIGSFQRELGVTLSLPSVVGRGGVTRVLQPELSSEERQGIEKSAETLRAALARVMQR